MGHEEIIIHLPVNQITTNHNILLYICYWFQLVWDNVQWYSMACCVSRRGQEGNRISDWL